MNNELQDPSETLEKHQELLDKEWDELLKRNLSNTENLTKYIFSLSSAGLEVSLVVVRESNFFVSANFKWILFLSWGAFLITIVCALVLCQVERTFRLPCQAYSVLGNKFTYAKGFY